LWSKILLCYQRVCFISVVMGAVAGLLIIAVAGLPTEPPAYMRAAGTVRRPARAPQSTTAPQLPACAPTHTAPVSCARGCAFRPATGSYQRRPESLRAYLPPRPDRATSQARVSVLARRRTPGGNEAGFPPHP